MWYLQTVLFRKVYVVTKNSSHVTVQWRFYIVDTYILNYLVIVSMGDVIQYMVV